MVHVSIVWPCRQDVTLSPLIVLRTTEFSCTVNQCKQCIQKVFRPTPTFITFARLLNLLKIQYRKPWLYSLRWTLPDCRHPVWIRLCKWTGFRSERRAPSGDSKKSYMWKSRWLHEVHLSSCSIIHHLPVDCKIYVCAISLRLVRLCFTSTNRGWAAPQSQSS